MLAYTKHEKKLQTKPQKSCDLEINIEAKESQYFPTLFYVYHTVKV